MAKTMTSSWADADNDGDLDVLIANNTLKSCSFYTNSGNGTFTKNETPGFTQNIGYYHHASWVDVDNDGQVELYLGNYWPTRLNELWKLDKNGNWNLWEDNLLSQITGGGLGYTWADYDNDGKQDIVILNNEGANNSMYHNLGDGQFESVTNAITTKGGHSVGSAWGDIDNDGDLDLFVSNTSNTDNDLFINLGNGQFSSVTSGQVVHDKGHSYGACFADMDKDSDLDLFVSNDQGVKFIYLNDGLGNFTAKTDEWPNTNFGNTMGSAFSDLDLDGDLDLVCATHNNQRNYIFTANNNTNTWLGIRLIGTNSNKCAIGARLRIKSNGKWQIREVNSQSGLGGQSSYRQHFGLGTATTVDSLEIYWPSGYKQVQTGINANQNMVITEENGAKLNGVAFYDANNNCIFDANEFPLNGVSFSLNNGEQICYTNADGQLETHLAVGDYTMQLSNSDYASTCTFPSQFSITAIGNDLNIGNIALRPSCEFTDLEVVPTTSIMRRGFHNVYTIEVKNNGVQTATGTTLSVTLPSSIILDLASPAWTDLTTSNGQSTITWDLGTMAYNDKLFIKLMYTVSTSVALEDVIASTFEANANETDCKPFNNLKTDYQSIFGSVDPNDILAYPSGVNGEHCIDDSQVMTYKIRFQNVGNYAAEFVNITDFLPENLDATSMHNVISSHNYLMTIEGRKLHFYFPKIQLPDSTSDQIGSNGFVQFSINQMSNNTIGTTIENMASIQFDYNESIVTNTVVNTVCNNAYDKEIGMLVAYPNPTSESVSIKAKVQFGNAPELNLVSIYRQDGSLVMREQFKTNQPRLETASLPSGLYVILAIDNKGKSYSGNLVVVH